MALPYLIVRARGRLCALPVSQVVEAMRLPALAPGASEITGWMGTTLLRGELVAVLELGALLGFAVESAPASRAVAVRLVPASLGESSQQHFALLAVDELIGVKTLEPDRLRQIALPGGGELPMGRFDAGFAQLIDASRLLPDTYLLPDPATLPANGLDDHGVAL